MKKLKFLTLAILLGLFFYSCSNSSNSKSEDKSDSSNTKIETTQIKRPEKTDENLKKMVYKFDSKVADVSSTLRELQDNIDKGAKVTPRIDSNITKMIEDTKKLREPILSQTDNLSEEEFSHFDYDKDWIDKLETEFESLKQTTKSSE